METLSKDYTPEALCRAMMERNADTISVRNPDIAVAKLVSIIEAVLTLSNRVGFHAMTLRQLATEAGMSMGGLYAYFDSKPTLLKMILTQVSASVVDALEDVPDGLADDPVAHLKWLIDRHIRVTDAMLPWFAFSFMEAKNFPPEERTMAIESETRTEEIFAKVVARAADEGLLRPEIVPLLPALIKPLLQDWYVKQSKYRRRGIDVETYIATVQDFVLAACLKHST